MLPASASTDAVPPSVAILRLLSGAWVSSAISLAARLGIADLLADGPSANDELARATDSDPDALIRLLRALASVGIFEETHDGRFQLTPLAESLQSGSPGSMHAFAVMLGQEWHWRSWGHLDHSVRTGESAFEHVYGLTGFEYWAQNADAGAIFDAAMTSRSTDEARAVLAAFDFSSFTTIADIGGGHGSFLMSVLQQYPHLQGVVFDQPVVVDGALPVIEAAGLHGRCRVAAGDFFNSIPREADTFVLKKIIHDWNDELAVQILRNCHHALPEGGRLLLVELVLPRGNEPSFSKLLDLLMLVWSHGGKERDASQYEALLAEAGFEMSGITATASPISVIEAVRR